MPLKSQVGGYNDMSPKSAESRAVAERALARLDAIANHPCTPLTKVTSVDKIQSQIVAGRKFIIKMKIKLMYASCALDKYELDCVVNVFQPLGVNAKLEINASKCV